MKRVRLIKLEQRAAALVPTPSLVLFEIGSAQKSGSFDEMLACGGTFRRFIDGGSGLRDVSRLLALWDAAAGVNATEGRTKV